MAGKRKSPYTNKLRSELKIARASSLMNSERSVRKKTNTLQGGVKAMARTVKSAKTGYEQGQYSRGKNKKDGR